MESLASNSFDIVLVAAISKHPSLHSAKHVYTAADEKIWDSIAKTVGIQKTMLKRRWQCICDRHRSITIHNRTHTDKVSPHRLSARLGFVPIDISQAHETDFGDLMHNKVARLHIDRSVLDDFDMYPDTTIASIKRQPHVVPEMEPSYPDERPPNGIQISSGGIQVTETVEKLPATCSGRDEDEIFGELVVAMLKKMGADQKKSAKKEIMNVLLV